MRALPRTLLAGFAFAVAVTACEPDPTADATGPGSDVPGRDAGPEDERSLPLECDAEPEACAVAATAAASLPYPWPTLGYDLVVREPIDDWHAGRTRPEQQEIELFVNPGDAPEALLPTLAHEVAHAIHQGCNEPLLEAWAERRELPADTPHHVEAPHEYDSVAEDYAEAFAQYLGYGPARSNVGDPVTQRWLQENADLFVPTVCDDLDRGPGAGGPW